MTVSPEKIAEMLPCPFCGGELTITKHFKMDAYNAVHRCRVVGAITYEMKPREAIVASWNTRSQLSGITDETSSGDRAVELASAELIKAGDALSFAAQTSGGTAGRDDALVAAIDGWAVARDKLPRRRLSQTSRPTHDQS